jgi:hypothetical protein
MEINGTIYRILQQEEVTFGDGTKKIKGGFVIMREGEYPKPVAFELFGEERLLLLNGLTLGMPVRVGFYAESRESKNGKYYTTLRCFNIMHLGATSNEPPVSEVNSSTNNTPSYSWNPSGNTVPTSDHKSTDIPRDNDLPWAEDEVPF